MKKLVAPAPKGISGQHGRACPGGRAGFSACPAGKCLQTALAGIAVCCHEVGFLKKPRILEHFAFERIQFQKQNALTLSPERLARADYL
ncbi:hypothetical protein [Desulfovibrio sp. ZJ200]|uniref:hypothetical protein n=1 Tax=Desulfovibrio sp. ZJ200 TaxID=2709792 RepID=UPI0013EA219B|nr:hypothetical protein [Desulfovibrio sp. ZJ200]